MTLTLNQHAPFKKTSSFCFILFSSPNRKRAIETIKRSRFYNQRPVMSFRPRYEDDESSYDSLPLANHHGRQSNANYLPAGGRPPYADRRYDPAPPTHSRYGQRPVPPTHSPYDQRPVQDPAPAYPFAGYADPRYLPQDPRYDYSTRSSSEYSSSYAPSETTITPSNFHTRPDRIPDRHLGVSETREHKKPSRVTNAEPYREPKRHDRRLSVDDIKRLPPSRRTATEQELVERQDQIEQYQKDQNRRLGGKPSRRTSSKHRSSRSERSPPPSVHHHHHHHHSDYHHHSHHARSPSPPPPRRSTRTHSLSRRERAPSAHRYSTVRSHGSEPRSASRGRKSVDFTWRDKKGHENLMDSKSLKAVGHYHHHM